jgi:hypothetical protein
MPRPDVNATRSRRLLPLGVVVVAFAAAAGVGVAIGAIGTSDPTPLPGPPVTNPAPIAQAPSSRALAAFGILRRDPTGSDALSAAAATEMANSYPVKAHGMNLTLARRASTDAGTVWIVPGNGSTCLVIDETPSATEAGSASCMQDADATAGRLAMSIAVNASEPHRQFIAGLVPDGVDQAVAQLSDGSTRALVVRDNVYTAALVDATAASVSFTDADGAVVVHP